MTIILTASYKIEYICYSLASHGFILILVFICIHIPSVLFVYLLNERPLRLNNFNVVVLHFIIIYFENIKIRVRYMIKYDFEQYLS